MVCEATLRFSVLISLMLASIEGTALMCPIRVDQLLLFELGIDENQLCDVGQCRELCARSSGYRLATNINQNIS